MDELREAIEELYYFEFVLDDIPIWGFVGYIEESGFLPHSHKVETIEMFYWNAKLLVNQTKLHSSYF